jgi:uncharacterized membrane protein
MKRAVLFLAIVFASSFAAGANTDWNLAILVSAIMFIIIAIVIFLLMSRKEALHEAAVTGNRGLSEDEDRFLLILYENEGIIEQTELMTQTSWPDAKTNVLIRSLEAQGYIRRIRKGRKNIIKATEKGNAFNKQRRQ